MKLYVCDFVSKLWLITGNIAIATIDNWADESMSKSVPDRFSLSFTKIRRLSIIIHWWVARFVAYHQYSMPLQFDMLPSQIPIEILKNLRLVHLQSYIDYKYNYLPERYRIETHLLAVDLRDKMSEDLQLKKTLKPSWKSLSKSS